MTINPDNPSEHRHEGYDYWHPIMRVHDPIRRRKMPVHFNTIYPVSEDEVYDTVEALSGVQSYYTGKSGVLLDLPWAMAEAAEYETLSPEWCMAVSKIPSLITYITYSCGKVRRVRVQNAGGEGITFIDGYAHYEAGTEIHNARVLLETGLAAMYINYPSLEDAMHILRVAWQGPETDMDTIRLPSGRHVFADVLEKEYGVSWEIIAKIPIGAPQSDSALLPTGGSISQMEQDNTEIQQIISVCNWCRCRYIRG